MRTSLQAERIRLTNNWGQDQSIRRLTQVLLTGGLVLVAGLANGARVAEGANFCRQTSRTVASSCQAEARSDFLLATAKCANLVGAAERKNCREQASADQKDATQMCKDQYDARQAECARLGEAPYDPVIDPANFLTSTTINNPFFLLTPGTTFIYEGQTVAGFEHDEFFVTHNTKVILGVTCIEVHDTSTVDGVLTEDTFDWFAQDNAGNVWYFGENARQLVDGVIVGVEGSWTAGVDGAKPGIIMEAQPQVGDFYRQEFALDAAEDVAEVVSLNGPVSVPYGVFQNCLETEETSPLEPNALEHKFYCKGVGNVLTQDITAGETLPLVQITTGG